MSTEARKKRRKRNQYRQKLVRKGNEMEQIVARLTLIKLTAKGVASSYETGALERQKTAITRKIARLNDILASLSPAYKPGGPAQKGNTS